MNEQSIILLQKMLNFFVHEDIVYSTEHKAFLVKKNVLVKEDNNLTEKYETIGIINKENYSQVCNMICQRNRIKSNHSEDFSKAKNSKALEIMKKLKKGKDNMSKKTKADKNMELGNIISSVANKSQSLNILNIWDLTIYQLWDSFARLSNNSIYEIESMSVAAWGNKDKHFDFNSWFKLIETEN